MFLVQETQIFFLWKKRMILFFYKNKKKMVFLYEKNIFLYKKTILLNKIWFDLIPSGPPIKPWLDVGVKCKFLIQMCFIVVRYASPYMYYTNHVHICNTHMVHLQYGFMKHNTCHITRHGV